MTDDRLPWFQCYPSKLLGALAGMSADEKLVYVIVLLRIYDVRGPCPDTIAAIARRCDLSKRRAAEALDALFNTGKLESVDGKIMNEFAARILADEEAFREDRARAGAAGGKKSAEKRKQKQGNDPSNAQAKSTHLDSEEEKKEESKTPAPAEAGLFAVDASSQSDWPKDYQDQFWKSYPRRTEKKAAMAKLDAIRKGGKVRWEIFFAGVQRYAQHMRGTEERYIKHPTTWLNRGCWDDEFAPGSGSGGPYTGPPPSRNGIASLLVQMTKGRRDDANENVEPVRALPAR